MWCAFYSILCSDVIALLFICEVDLRVGDALSLEIFLCFPFETINQQKDDPYVLLLLFRLLLLHLIVVHHLFVIHWINSWINNYKNHGLVVLGEDFCLVICGHVHNVENAGELLSDSNACNDKDINITNFCKALLDLLFCFVYLLFIY